MVEGRETLVDGRRDAGQKAASHVESEDTAVEPAKSLET
jgi:hypothetical protein